MKNNRIYNIILTFSLLTHHLGSWGQGYPNLTQTQVPGTGSHTVDLPSNFMLDTLNYIRTYRPKVRIANEAQVNDNSSPEQVGITTTYTNGLGATIQVVQQNASKANNGAYLHLVTPADVRSIPEQYKFSAFPSTVKTFNQNAISQSLNYHSGARYPSETGVSNNSISIGLVKNTSSPTERSMTSYAPGKSRVSQNRGVKTKLISNATLSGIDSPGNNVRIWTINASGMPVSNAVYAAFTLSGSMITNADGLEKYVFSDRDGKIVYEATLQETSGSTNQKIYAEIYHVYDDFGRLRYTLTPKAVATAKSSSWSVSQTLIDELCFAYLYDAKGRQHSVHMPGEAGFTELVYSKEGQLIMRRTPIEKIKGVWELFFYDKRGRNIATALYQSTNDRAFWQSQALATPTQSSSSPFFYIWGPGQYQHPPKAGLSATEMLSYKYYDSYDQAPLNTDVYNSAPFQGGLLPQGDVPSTRTSAYGFMTGSEVKLVHNPDVSTGLQSWTSSKHWYDSYGRSIYTVGQNATGAKDSLYTQYNQSGQVILSLSKQNAMTAAGNVNTEQWTKYEYESYSGRLLAITRKTNGSNWEPVISKSYDEFGRVSKEILGADAETRVFTYTIRGELQGINEQYALTGDKGGYEMTFGEALRYDYGVANPRYDGLVAAMIWRGSGGNNVKAHSYSYLYDLSGRMTAAHYGEASNSTGIPMGWNTTQRNYTETIRYDQNGNILAASRWGVSQNPSFPGPRKVDSLTYHYFGNSNKLQKVTDAVSTDYGTGDYLPGSAQGYNYDASGNLIEDRSKGIQSVTYTWFNKPQTVTFANGNKIYYTYDASGAKIQEVSVISGNQKKVNYILNAVYQNDSLQYLLTAQGRVDMRRRSPRAPYSLLPPQEQFFVKDHLGNIRSIVASSGSNGSGPVPFNYVAGYEPENEQIEELFFEQVSDLREDKPGSFSSVDNKAALLDAQRSTGTSIMLKVMAGDKLDVKADNFYESISAQGQKPDVAAGAILEGILGGLANGEGSLNPTTDLPTSGGLANALPANADILGAYEALIASSTDSTKPKAFLNYLFFDERMQLLPEHSRIWQADGENYWSKIGNEQGDEIVMPQNGFIVVYLSNQSATEAYFDNLSLELSPGILIEEKHYYPYGLVIAGLGATASNALNNRYSYQGNEYITESGLEWMDFHNRQYDPQLGRFLGIDPLAGAGGQQVLSPYHAMGCNPVTMVDPLGLRFYGSSDNLPNYGIGSAGVAYIEGESVVLGGSWLESFEKQLERLNERAAMLAEEAHLRAITGLYQALLEFLAVYGSETLLSGGTLVFSTDPKDGVSDVLVIAKGNDQLGGEEQANGGEESNKGLQSSGGTNWYGPGGQVNWFLGAAGTALENTAGSFRLGTAKLGFSPKYYPNAWGGNQYAKTFNISKMGGAIGKISFGAAFVMDGVGLYNFYRNPNSPNVVSPSKFGVNTAVGLYSLKVNPALGIVYFGVDAFYPGGWLGNGTNPGAIMDQSRMINGVRQTIPNFNMYRDIPGGW